MSKNSSFLDLDSNGKPCNYTDQDGTIWIYQGKRYGFSDWGGIPIEP